MPSKRQIGILAAEIRRTQEELMDFLKSKHPSEIMVIEGVRGFFQAKDDIQVFHYIQNIIFPHTIQIKTRDLEFFKGNREQVFQGLPKKYIDRYADLILGSPEEDLAQIWAYFQALIDIYELSLKKKKNN